MLNKLLKLANQLDNIGQYRAANEIDLLLKDAKEKLENDPTPQKGDGFGGGADQESEAAEETNEEMVTLEMEEYTPNNDNLVIDKNNNPTDGFGVL
jgi:hypothetical protein